MAIFECEVCNEDYSNLDESRAPRVLSEFFFVTSVKYFRKFRMWSLDLSELCSQTNLEFCDFVPKKVL